MLGLFGTSVIGTDAMVSPKSASQNRQARFARHELVRGTPILQDLGDDAGTRQLGFYFDDAFCNPELELRKIDLAFANRVPMKLFFDLIGFEVSTFLIERIRIKSRQTSRAGRLTRVDVEVELIESPPDSTKVEGAAAGISRAIRNPVLRRR